MINLKIINEIFENVKYNRNIIPFEKYADFNNFKRDILKILISIFYYEKPSDKNENIFNVYQQYYLISPEWLKEFKEFYNYQNLYELLIKDNLYNK